WPDGRSQFFQGVKANQTLILDYGDATTTYTVPKVDPPKTLMRELDNRVLVPHREDGHNDLDYEGLAYQKLSQEGPALAVADVNGDGHEDIFIGGAQGQEASLYLHRGNGRIVPKNIEAFLADREHEDVVAAFFDADGDGDLDLIVGSGGNNVNMQRSYRARLYLNDGQGNFSKAPQELPSTFRNISTISPHDFDGDG